MYQNIGELPTQVTISLDHEDAKRWMDKYNDAVKDLDDPSEKDLMAARRKAWWSVRERPSSYSFCAKATIEAVDKDKELVDLDSVKKHMDSYIEHFGPLSWDHSSYIVGTVWGWDEIDTKDGPGIQVWGNLFKGDEPVYKTVRNAFSKGANSLSISGEATKGEFQCDSDKGCYMRRTVKQLMEIAVTPHPINQYSTLVWKNSSLSKSARGIALAVCDIEVHRSEDECPIMRLKKAFRAVGADAHARSNGVFIPMPEAKVDANIAKARDMGLYAYCWYDSKLGTEGMFVREPDALLETEFKKAYRDGLVDADGALTKSVDEKRFKDLWRKGLLTDDGRFRSI